MAVVTTTTRGQATFRKEFFQHVGIKPGDQFEIDYLPNGEFKVSLRANPSFSRGHEGD